MWAYLAALSRPRRAARRAAAPRARARPAPQERFDDYRREFRYDHPDARRDFAEYAVEGWAGRSTTSGRCCASSCARRGWSPSTTRASPPICASEFPGARGRSDSPRHGRPADRRAGAADGARAACAPALGVPDDAVVFAAFGKMTAEKRIGAILRALRRARGASAPTCICCWSATRRTIPALERGTDGIGASRRASTSPATLPDAGDRRLPRGGRRLPLPALADRARNVGVVAALPGGGAADGHHRSRAPRRHPDARSAQPPRVARVRRAGGHRHRSARRGRVAACWRCARSPPSRAARLAGARRPRVLGGEPHARRHGRATTSG